MADFDSADLLSRFRGLIRIGTNTADSSDAELYGLLSNAQHRLIQILAAHCPWTQVTAPTALTSTDSGVTYTFGSGVYPLGHLELYNGVDGPRLLPLGYGDNLWDGYVLEGATIRFPGNRARTFANGLYARYIAVPSAISASVEPTLKPSYARQGIVYDAASEWSHQGGAVDPAPYDAMLQKFLWGDPRMPGDVGLLGALKTQANHRGIAAGRGLGGAWWRGGDFLTGPT